MNKAILLIALSLLTLSCKNKDLHDLEPIEDHQTVNVRFAWQEVRQPTAGKMRMYLSSHEPEKFGDQSAIALNYSGGSLNLPVGARYDGLAYSYNEANNIVFLNNNTYNVEATCNPLTRASYASIYSGEDTYLGPDDDLFVGSVDDFLTARSNEPVVMEYFPVNVVKSYTFEINGIRGSENIRACRGAISGMSNVRRLATGTISQDPITLFFTVRLADVNTSTGQIRGSFRTFGRVGSSTNHFTVEIVFPASDNRIIQERFDVTAQIEPGAINPYHIVIDGSAIDIPDESHQNPNGWEVTVDEWEDEKVKLL